ncbi:predicted protein [Phaeodactylum tricornutum CCAP 1055/1]|uniref:U3 small nucleolar RNA-associated protein 22 n=2 Tax=Phaeodactylum tricornutum TaxID=2850 RepID=B7S3Y5_PHATC|nr:predicted protein [Phaeodactylum tricornutum CCAP 1055/1]EEC42738.1 predicted protein [Phaeodactylum tricornutum CCAP 1055/1]|eukprot:XP_002176274.1 predicted protein [Phaeodactylum tricornutum CCAP 1055/1]
MSKALKHQRQHQRQQNGVAADAEFLDTMDQTATVLELHRSNLLRLQTDELLKAISLDVSPSSAHVHWATYAHEYIQKIQGKIESLQVDWKYDKDSPFPILSDRKNISVHSSLTTLSGNARVIPTLEVLVKVPNDAFDFKDYLRERYFDKRNLVVWHVARYLSQRNLRAVVGKVCYRFGNSDLRKPELLLIPPCQVSDNKIDGEGSIQSNKRLRKPRFRLCLRFGMTNCSWIPPLRFVPNRCNLSHTKSSQAYNHALAEEAAHEFEDLSSSSIETYPNLNQALILAKIWCLQRGLLCHDGLKPESLGLLLLFLYRTKQVSPRMGVIQTLTALLKLLTDTDWLGNKQSVKRVSDAEKQSGSISSDQAYRDLLQKQNPRRVLILPKEGDSVNDTVAASELAKLYTQQTTESPLTDMDPLTLLELYERDYRLGPVFLDPSMTYNYLGRVSPSCMRLIQLEAQKSLECLHGTSHTRPFPYLFMIEARFWSRFDSYIRVPIKNIAFSSALWGDDRRDLGDFESISRGLVRILTLALGDRVKAIRVLSTGNGPMNMLSSALKDSDEVPTKEIALGKRVKVRTSSPTGSDFIVLALTLNPDTCWRKVERGPPADDLAGTKAFLDLWGSKKAELRRFKDGAIVHAVVWDATVECMEGSESDAPYILFQNDDKVQGGIVERIVRHILQMHFLKTEDNTFPLEFSLRNLLSSVDGVVSKELSSEATLFNPLSAHRNVMKAFDALSTFLRKHSAPALPATGYMHSRLGIPLSIDAVEPLSPSLRYSELFPPIPHPSLGYKSTLGLRNVSGSIQSKPVQVQVRFGLSSKWPSDLRAIGAAKTAMLIKLLEGIEDMKRQGAQDSLAFYGPTAVTPDYADIGFMGYVFRIFVRADPELKLLKSVVQPTREAATLLNQLRKRHVIGSMHHSLVHSVFTSHPSSSVAARMATRWLSTHLMSGMIPFEAVELLIVSVYTQKSSPLDAPGSAVTGLLRFFHLLATHNWAKEPLVVDPHCSLTEEDYSQLLAHFDGVRGIDLQDGPPMYIVTPYDQVNKDLEDAHEVSITNLPTKSLSWTPAFTSTNPEWVVLSRLSMLASRTYSFLQKSLVDFQRNNWSAAFQVTAASFHAYSAVLRIGPDFVVDSEASSTGGSLSVRPNKNGAYESSYTRSMQNRSEGPKLLRRKLYRNLVDSIESHEEVILEWRPVDALIDRLRSRLGSWAVFFYNDLCPEVIGVLWRPLFEPRSFSALASEYARPMKHGILGHGYSSDC